MPDGTLYADSNRKHFYWIPKDTMVQTGELTLRTLTGEVLLVDPAAAAEYEIDEARAKAMARETMAKVGAQASRLLGGLGAMLQEASGKLPQPDPSTADALAANFTALVEGLGNSLEDLIDEAPAAREVTEQRMRKLAERAGIDPDDPKLDVAALREKIQQFLGTPELIETLEGYGEKLKALTRDLERSARDLKRTDETDDA